MPEPRDRISVGCSAGLNTPSCIPAIVSTPDELHWTFLLGLEGDSSVLDGADIPSSPFAWNQMSLDSILVTLIDENAHKSYGFVATPATFLAVPEPSSCVSIFFGTVLLALLGRITVDSRSLFGIGDD